MKISEGRKYTTRYYNAPLCGVVPVFRLLPPCIEDSTKFWESGWIHCQWEELVEGIADGFGLGYIVHPLAGRSWPVNFQPKKKEGKKRKRNERNSRANVIKYISRPQMDQVRKEDGRVAILKAKRSFTSFFRGGLYATWCTHSDACPRMWYVWW